MQGAVKDMQKHAIQKEHPDASSESEFFKEERCRAVQHYKMSTDTTKLKVIITGATGMVGEGVLFACLEHPAVEQVLLLSRKPYPAKHPKLKECIVRDFLNLDGFAKQLTGYDACFYCAGISSAGMSEAEYTRIT